MNVRNFKQAAVVASNLRKVLPASSHFQGLNCVRIPYTRYLIQMCESNKRSYVTTPLSNPVLDVPVLREHALDIFNTAVNAVLPQSMVTRALQLEGNVLTVNGQSYELKHNVHIVAFGKAVIGMVRAAEDVLGDHIVGGIASVPHGIQDTLRNLGKWDLLPSSSSRVKIMEGAENNIPDEDAHKAAMEIHSLLEKLTEDDIVLALFSGGGSALLPAPVPPITLSEMAEVTKILSLKGATIQQLNTVRKHLELLKGGGLARTAFPARVIALGLSNVVGNTLDVIASGPSVADFSTPEQCLEIFRKYNLLDKVPKSTVVHLQAQDEHYKLQGLTREAAQTSLMSFHCRNVQNFIIGSNHIGMLAACQRAIHLGYLPYILSCGFTGEARDTGVLYSKLAIYLCHSMANNSVEHAFSLDDQELDLEACGVSKDVFSELRDLAHQATSSSQPVCIMGSGKTTLTVSQEARGVCGRNQEMALSAAVYMGNTVPHSLKQNYSVVFMSADTDGHDGPTKAAGAFADPWLLKRAADKRIDIIDFYNHFDSHTFYSQFEGARNIVKTGLTGTNVMDIQLLMILPRSLPFTK